MEPILHLKYTIDKDILLQQAAEIKSSASVYVDPRPGLGTPDWLIKKHTSEYIEKIIADLGINARPRFYWLKPFASLKEHTDNGTECSVNFIISENAAPITIEGIDYLYRSALLNTQRRHSVTNGPEERILLKISIFDKTYEEIYAQFEANPLVV